MSINSIWSGSGPASPATSQAAAGTPDRNMFMTLLVAQLKNQDPLAPQDGAEFVAQLAQFNSLDQLIGIRQSLERLIHSMQQNQAQTNNTNY